MAPELTIDRRQLNDLVGELHKRGGGIRESGAFLLADARITDAGTRNVVAVAFYDDLDARSLTGGITFGADGYTALAALCRARRQTPVGDVHTHPGTFVRQSAIDAANPMIAIAGHVAIIVPNFAAGPIGITDVGVHIFLGSGRWTSAFGDDVKQHLRVTRRPLFSSAAELLRRILRGLRTRFGHR